MTRGFAASVIKNTNSPVCDSKTTLKGLDHQHLWWQEKAISTISVLENLQEITPVEDTRELFGYKTLNTKEAHSFSLWKSLLKMCLGFPLYTSSVLLKIQYV